MATYKALRGLTIRTIDGDASPLIDGDIWYNSSSRKIKGVKLAAAAFASSNNMNTGRDFMGCAGTQTATITAGGEPPNTSKAEQYDGSSWTEVGDLVSGARYGMRGFGSVTAGIIAGGYPPTSGGTVTESWNGTGWTEVGDLNSGRYSFGSALNSPQSAGLVMGGISGGHGNETVNVETWDNSSWTETTNMNTARAAATGTGTATAAIACGGSPGSGVDTLTAICETWDGSSWTETADLNQVRDGLGGSTGGTYTSALGFGGRTGEGAHTANTESFDGSSWTETTNIPAALRAPGGTGSPTAGLVFGGSLTGGNSATTVEFNHAPAAVTFTSS